MKFIDAEAIQKVHDSKIKNSNEKNMTKSFEQNDEEPSSGPQPSSRKEKNIDENKEKKVDSKNESAESNSQIKLDKGDFPNESEKSGSNIKFDKSESKSESLKSDSQIQLDKADFQHESADIHSPKESQEKKTDDKEDRGSSHSETKEDAKEFNSTNRITLMGPNSTTEEVKVRLNLLDVREGKKDEDLKEPKHENGTSKSSLTSAAPINDDKEKSPSDKTQTSLMEKSEKEQTSSDAKETQSSAAGAQKEDTKGKEKKGDKRKDDNISEDNINKIFEDLPEEEEVKTLPSNNTEVVPLKEIFNSSFLWKNNTAGDEAGNFIAEKNDKELNTLSELVSDEDSAAATSSASQSPEQNSTDDYIEHLQDSSPLIYDPFEYSDSHADTDSVSRKKSEKDDFKKVRGEKVKHENEENERLKLKKHLKDGSHTLHAYLNQLDILMDKIVKPKINQKRITSKKAKQNLIKSSYEAPREYKLTKVPQYLTNTRINLRAKGIKQSLMAMKKLENSKEKTIENENRLSESKSEILTKSDEKERVIEPNKDIKQIPETLSKISKESNEIDMKRKQNASKVVNEDVDADENVSSMIESSIRKNGIHNIEGILSTFYNSLIAYKKKTGIKDIDITKFKPHIQKALKAELEKEREKKKSLLKQLKGYFNSSVSHKTISEENARVRNKTQLPVNYINNTGLLDLASFRKKNPTDAYLRNNTFESYKGYEKKPSLMHTSAWSSARSTRNKTSTHSDPLIVGDVDLIANDKDAMENKVELHEESANIFDSDDPPQKPHINITLTHNDTFYHDNTAANAEKDNAEKDFGITNLNIFHTYKSVKKDSLRHFHDHSAVGLLRAVDREIIKYFSGVDDASKRGLYETLTRAQKRNLNDTEETKRRQYVLDVLKDLKGLTREYDGAVRLKNKTMARKSLKKLMNELERLHNNSNYVFPDNDNYINTAVQEDIKENSDEESSSRDTLHDTIGSDGNDANKNIETTIVAVKNDTLKMVNNRQNKTEKLMEMHQAHRHLKELLLKELKNLNNKTYLDAAANDSSFRDDEEGTTFSKLERKLQNATASSHVASTKATKTFKIKDNSSGIIQITKNDTAKDSLLQKEIKKTSDKSEHSFSSAAHSDLTKLVNTLTVIHNKTKYALPPSSTEEDVDLVFGTGDGNQVNKDDIEEISYDIKITNTSSTKNNNGTKEGNSSVQVSSKSNPELNMKEETHSNDTDTKTSHEGNNGDNLNKTKAKIDDLMEKHFNHSDFDMNLNGGKQNNSNAGKLGLTSNLNENKIPHNFINKSSVELFSIGDRGIEKSDSYLKPSYIFDNKDTETKSKVNTTTEDKANSSSIVESKIDNKNQTNSIPSLNGAKQVNNTNQTSNYNEDNKNGGDNKTDNGDNNQHKHPIMDLLFTGNKTANMSEQMLVNNTKTELMNKTKEHSNFNKGNNLLIEDNDLGLKSGENENTLLSDEKETPKRPRKTKKEYDNKNITKNLNETSPPPPKVRGKSKEQLPEHTPLAPNETSYSFDIVNYIESDLNEYFNKSQLLNHAYPELLDLLQEDDNSTGLNENNLISDSEMDQNIDKMIQEINENNNTSPGNMINVSSFTHGNFHQIQENGILKKRQAAMKKKQDCVEREEGLGIVDLFDGRPTCNNTNGGQPIYKAMKGGEETGSKRSFNMQNQRPNQLAIKKSMFTRYINPLVRYRNNKKSFTPKPQTQSYYQTVPKDKKTMHEFALSFGDENDLIL